MAATINVTQIVSEFGTYIESNQKDILQKLIQGAESQKFMTSVVSKSLEYRAAQAAIDDMVQGFQKAWTPKGTAAFTPISLPQRRHKFDIEFYPDEIVETWLGFLANLENMDRKAWTISKYILEQLVLPKVAENRELKLIGVGNYTAPAEGVAQATGLSMDGFCTILEDKKTAGTSNINFINLNTLSKTNIFDEIESFVDAITEVYQASSMRIFLSRSWYKAYHRRRRDLHGEDNNYDGSKDTIEGSNNILTPLPSMASKNIILATPQANFLRLLNGNENVSNISVENVDRKVKIYADWYESVGFGIEEAIFAYVPDEESGSGS